MVHWRNFQGQVDMPLAPQVFLLGPNASGKSNVLDALRFLRDTAGPGLAGRHQQPGEHRVLGGIRIHHCANRAVNGHS